MKRTQNSSISQDITIDTTILKKLGKTWSKRVAVSQFNFDLSEFHAPGIPEFPEHLLPSQQHPWYQCLDKETYNRLLAAAWIAYNDKTIAIEDHIINPFCRYALRNQYPGISSSDFKTVIAQTLVDEHYHILLCIEACNISRDKYNIVGLDLPKPLVAKRLEEKCKYLEQQSKAIAYLAYASVAEMTINAYLSILSSDRSIQPLNRMSVEWHRRDEAAHSSLFIEIVKAIYSQLTDQLKDMFVEYLIEAYQDFTAKDFTAWQEILAFFQCDCISEIETNNYNIVPLDRNLKGIHKLLSELSLTGDARIINAFQFSTIE